jgi:hypothetical protein
LLHLDTGAYFSVNKIGALVWSLTEEHIRFGDLVARTRGRLEDAPATLEEDVGAFIGELSARGLISWDEPEVSERPQE